MSTDMPEVENQVQAEEEEDEDGPPPGFHSIIRLPPTQSGRDEAAPVDDDGPPPGFECFAPKPTSSLPSSDAERGSEHQDTEDDDGPPPGWEFSSLARALPKTPSITIDEKNERVEEIKDGEDEDDGPPPGWETVLPHQIPLPSTPPLQPSSAVSSGILNRVNLEIEMGSKSDITRTDDEVPGSVSTPKPVSGRSSPPTPPLKQGPEIGCQEGEGKNGDKNSKSAKQSASPKRPIPPAANPLTPPMASSSSEKAQLVCGTCRKLLLYPRGAKWVKCPGCQDLNFVLEAHEVGQVKCGGCTTLLMYPHGAPAVQCSSCHAVTEIGDHNRRPPLSVQQAQAQRRRRRNRVR